MTDTREALARLGQIVDAAVRWCPDGPDSVPARQVREYARAVFAALPTEEQEPVDRAVPDLSGTVAAMLTRWIPERARRRDVARTIQDVYAARLRRPSPDSGVRLRVCSICGHEWPVGEGLLCPKDHDPSECDHKYEYVGQPVNTEGLVGICTKCGNRVHDDESAPTEQGERVDDEWYARVANCLDAADEHVDELRHILSSVRSLASVAPDRHPSPDSGVREPDAKAALYRIAQGVEDPQMAARRCLEAMGAEVPT